MLTEKPSGEQRYREFMGILRYAQEKTGCYLVAEVKEERMGKGLIVKPVLKIMQDPNWVPEQNDSVLDDM